MRSFVEVLGICLFLAAFGCSSVYRQQYDLYHRIADWEGAARVLEKARVEDPDDPEIYFLLGQAYGHRGRFEEMDEAFKRSLSLSGRYATEIDQLREYFIVEQLNKGIENYNRQDFEAAIDELLWIGTIRREENRHFRYLGLSYSRIGEYEEAARNLRLSAERNHDLDSKMELVRVYDILRRYRGVIDVSEEILDRQPEQIDVLRIVAAAYEREGEMEKAIETYGKILELSPSSSAAMYNLALLLCREGRKGEAIPLLERLAVQDPDSLEIRYAVCSLLYETGRYEESLSCFQDYLAWEPMNVQVLRHLFVLNRRLNRWEEAKRIRKRLEMLDAVSTEMESDHENSREIEAPRSEP